MHSIADFMSQLLSPAAGSQGLLGSLTAIGVAYLGGVISSLTPCVYPMIPITVSVVGGMGGGGANHTDKKARWHQVWVRGFFYVAGMALVYSCLGVLAGLTGKVFGTLTNTAGWYVSLSLVLALSALFMMEVIPFDPSVWLDSFKHRAGFKRKAHRPVQHQEMTWLGAFTLGASSGFLAAPCTTPVLTAILAFIAKSQSVGMGLALMVSFSLGLGTLLLIIAAFAGALQILPRSGVWMQRVKVASGLMLLGFSLYLMYRAGALGGI
jgi:thiol:disulfide interchange protein DsbD